MAMVLRRLLRRAVADPVRENRLRWETWPRGFAAVGGLAALALVGTLLVALLGSALRPWLPLHTGVDSVTVTGAGSLARLVLLVAVALLASGGIHARWPLRWLSLLAVLLFAGYASVDLTVDRNDARWPLLLMLAGWLALAAFSVLRSRRPPVWWEFVVCWLLVLAMGLTPFLVNLHTLGTGDTDGPLTGLQLILLSGWSLPLIVLSGAALGDLATGAAEAVASAVTSAPPAVGGLALAVSMAALLADTGQRVLRRWQDDQALLTALFSALVVVVLAALIAVVRQSGWWPAASPDHGPDGVGLIAISAIAIALPGVLRLTLILTAGLFTILDPAGLTAARLGQAAAGLADRALPVQAGSQVVAALIALAVAAIHLRSGRRQAAVAAMALAVLVAGDAAGLLSHRFRWSPGDASALATPVVCGLVVWWGVRGQLGAPRRIACLAAVWLLLALGHIELLSDPLGLALGLTGATFAAVGLLWTMLTSGELANGDSPGFPRVARAQLVLGALVVGTLNLAWLLADKPIGQSSNVTDDYLAQGTNVIGAAIILAALARALGAAARSVR